MASLTLTIGTLTASVSADNDKAIDVLTQYADAIGIDGTNQEKADAVVQSLVDIMLFKVRSHRRQVATAAAMAEIETELSELGWA